jgi:predicted lipoprotein with Yx(FWY)xxD motif
MQRSWCWLPAVVLVLGVVLALRGAPATAGATAASDAPLPSLTELPTSATSHPWFSASPLAAGYVEQEFQMAGTAGLYTYATPPPPPWTIEPARSQPYATRLIVRRPADPAKFNGTVVVEWLNVTAGFDQDIEWARVGEHLTHAGFAYVGVSAQAAGVDALKKWDPSRYGSLTIADDGLSYDIFSQAGAAVRQLNATLLGGLPVKHVLGTGASQSAWRLVVYVNAFHPLAHAYDGYLLHSRGRGSPPIQGTGVIADQRPVPIRDDLDAPVLVLQTEGDLLTLDYAVARQPDTDHIRTWEVAGAPHVGGGTPYDTAVANGIRARDVGTAPPPSNPTCLTNPFPIWPVADAAWDRLRAWVDGGAPPATSPLIALSRQPTLAAIPPGDGNSLIARDDLGNAQGGIRTPALDAPLGTYYGSSPCNPGALGFLAGQFEPFDAQTLARLYPTHDDYVAKVTASVQAAVADGFMLPDDADKLVADAKASTIPSLDVAQAPPPTVQTREAGELGTVLADRQGFTLYTTSRDRAGASTCIAECAATWAPTLLESGDPVPPPDLPGRLGISVRPDGGRQVTYDQRPLYRYTGDQKPGDTSGDGVDDFHVAQASP